MEDDIYVSTKLNILKITSTRYYRLGKFRIARAPARKHDYRCRVREPIFHNLALFRFEKSIMLIGICSCKGDAKTMKTMTRK